MARTSNSKPYSLKTHSTLYSTFEIMRYVIPAMLFIIKFIQVCNGAVPLSWTVLAYTLAGMGVSFLLCVCAQWVILISWVKAKDKIKEDSQSGV